MAKKGRARALQPPAKTKFREDETFDDSQDEFFAGQDKILLDEEPAAKRRRKLEDEERYLQPSDEEVLSYDSGDEDNAVPSEADSDQRLMEEDENDDGTNWGASKSDYYNNDVIETEADAKEEEAEARRLQQKQLKSMTAADFGFDDNAWTVESDRQKGTVVEKLPELQIPVEATTGEKLEILHIRYPEFELLAAEFRSLQLLLASQPAKEPMDLKQQALSTYLGALAMYFAIFTMRVDPKVDSTAVTALPPDELRDHAIISSLTRAKQVWDTLKDIEIMPKPLDTTQVELPKKLKVQKPVTKLEVNEPQTRKRRQEKETIHQERPQKTRRMNLQSLLASHEAGSDSDAEFGDEKPLTEEQSEEKARKKRSLRFYSSQIAQKAHKRGMASREAGGDDDLPHKERLRDRQERLLKEAEKRGQQAAMDHERLDMNEDDMIAEGQDDAYYQSLVAGSNRKKVEKQAKADAYAEAVRQGGQIYEEESVGPDGKRAITYAIQKNKGLMPKRSKDVRNPRVKKRKKYDEKKKKLGSIRQIYKGGEGRGGYGGELTGIKTNVVKSVKL